MTPDTPEAPNDVDILATCSGQVSPGCPTAGPVLDGYSERQKFQIPTPTISYRADFGPIAPPNRTQNPFTFLHPGSYVVFQLDTQEFATQFHVPQGSESFKRCLEFPTKRYVGLVVGSFGGENDPDVQPYDIAFVSESLPPGSGFDTENDSFAVPIAPTKSGNTNDRTPLRPKPFPWTGCYQYTVLGARIAPTRTYPSAIAYRLNDEDFEDFEVACGTDYLATHTHGMSFPSDEEAFLFENMRVSDQSIPLPVKVWQELSAGQVCRDPREFVQELLHLQELVSWEVEEPCD